jgi:hypothetical protein
MSKSRAFSKNLFFFNRFRLSVKKLISHKWFDNIILGFIALNSLALAIERPSIKENSWVSNDQHEIFFEVIFFAFTQITGEKTSQDFILCLYERIQHGNDHKDNCQMLRVRSQCLLEKRMECFGLLPGPFVNSRAVY